MESPPSSPTSLVVSSPRRTLSLLRERRQKHRVPHPDEKASASFAAGFADDHGPKPSEVYGFVGSITTVIAAVIFIVWAYTPEPWLHYLGITYYPICSFCVCENSSMKFYGYAIEVFLLLFVQLRYWAIAIPSFAMVTVALTIVFYVGLNFMVTPPPTSFSIMFDEHSRERSIVTSTAGEEQPIEPISDIGVDQINNLMFG